MDPVRSTSEYDYSHTPIERNPRRAVVRFWKKDRKKFVNADLKISRQAIRSLSPEFPNSASGEILPIG